MRSTDYVPVSTVASNFSVYVKISNNTDVELKLGEHSMSGGKWVVKPEGAIAPNSASGFWVQDPVGLSGVSGSFRYTWGDNTVDLEFSCPTAGINKTTLIGVDNALKVKVGNGNWSLNPPVKTGHPLSLQIGVGNV